MTPLWFWDEPTHLYQGAWFYLCIKNNNDIYHDIGPITRWKP